MTVTPLQTTTGTGANITSIQTIGTYANTGVKLLRPQVRLSNLNGAAATITVKIRNSTDSFTAYRYSESKDVATDTGIILPLPSFLALDSKSYAVQVLSSNASDTNASWQVDWIDATHVDAVAIDGQTTDAAAGVTFPASIGTSTLAAGAQMDLVNAPNATAITAIQNGLATSANQTTILNRLGDFAGSGLNTIKGFLKALMSKAAALTPSEVGGTFDNTTDSAEAIRDNQSSAAPTAAANAAAVWANSTRTLTSADIVTAAETQSGTIVVIQGDSYLNADGNPKTITKVAGAPWPTTISGWTITFTARLNADNEDVEGSSPASITASGTVVNATDSGDTLQSVRFDLTASATAALSVGNAVYEYDVQASNGNSRVTLETGTMTVRKQQTTS